VFKCYLDELRLQRVKFTFRFNYSALDTGLLCADREREAFFFQASYIQGLEDLLSLFLLSCAVIYTSSQVNHEYYCFQPNVMTEWLGFPVHVRKVSDSNLDLDTNCSEIFRGFPQPFKNAGIVS
jgi:hypothetical protein